MKILNKFKPNTQYSVLYTLLIAVLTFLCYHYSLHNTFTNWDDQRFIPQNLFIRSFSSPNLKMMLFHDVTGDYYNPLTILSYAVNYHFSQLSPLSYYLTNIIIHIVDSVLVFFLSMMLFTAMKKKGYSIIKNPTFSIQNLSLICALFFAIHPMHVESVSWIAERKDVLYAYFYFLGLMAYVRYSETNKIKWFIGVIACFILSLLSKPMAVVFPLSLLAIDVLLKRDKSKPWFKLLVEKSPLFIISIASAVSTWILTKASGSTQEHQVFPLFQRFLFACYGFYMYIVKAIIPIGLSSFYPYPEYTTTGSLPLFYYFAPVVALLFLSVPLYFAYKSSQNAFRMVLFGFGFFFFNMFMVSQIIGSGPVIMADRYSYICYFGIFFPVIYFVSKIPSRKIVIASLSIYVALLAFLCYQRTLVWHDSKTLWSDVIEKYPHRIVKAYNNLGNYYFENLDFDNAYKNYNEAIQLRTGDPQVFCNMGSVLAAKQQYKASLKFFNQSLKIDSLDGNTYLDRGITYSAMGRFNDAISDYNKALILPSDRERLIRHIGYTYLNANIFDSAKKYYTIAIGIDPANDSYYQYRGMAEFNNKEYSKAIQDFLQAIKINGSNKECIYYVSLSYNATGYIKSALQYAEMAVGAGYNVSPDYIRLLKAKME